MAAERHSLEFWRNTLKVWCGHALSAESVTYLRSGSGLVEAPVIACGQKNRRTGKASFLSSAQRLRWLSVCGTVCEWLGVGAALDGLEDCARQHGQRARAYSLGDGEMFWSAAATRRSLRQSLNPGMCDMVSGDLCEKGPAFRQSNDFAFADTTESARPLYLRTQARRSSER
jgi:hypothetical protein